MFRRVSTGVQALCLVALAIASTPSTPFAQSVTGTILGTVTDDTGAVVAGAKVTIVNEGTGLTRAVVADTRGEYTAPSLPTGHYTVTSEMSGFKTVALSNIEVGVDQRAEAGHSLGRDHRQRHGVEHASILLDHAYPVAQRGGQRGIHDVELVA